jgi:Rod binding domain-containing protein
MDIHLLPGMTTAATATTPASSTPAVREPGDQPELTFQTILGHVTPKTDKVEDTAKQFEALIMGQVLKAAREASDGGWLGTGEDQTGQLALEMAEQGFAQALAARGTLGIAKLVTSKLRRDGTKAASSGHSAPLSPLQPSKGSAH